MTMRMRGGAGRNLSILAYLFFIFGMVVAQLLVVTPRAAVAANLSVNNTGDAPDANPGDGVCATAGAVCTLRAAIQEANALAGADTVSFNLPTNDPGYDISTGRWTIAPSSALPFIVEVLTIDGLTQPGAGCAAWPPTLQIEIDASGTGFYGFRVDGGPFTMRGIVLNRYAVDGVFLEGTTSGNRFECNFIGTNSSGTAALGDGQSAVFANGADNNLFGGPAVSQRNLFSGANLSEQLRLAGSDGNIVQGNYIGTDVSGTTTIAGFNNRAILITGSNNQIGGTTGTTPGGACTGACNVIAGAVFYQIWISAPGITGNVVAGNHIGVNAAGTARASLASSTAGIQIDSGALNTTIGGATAAARNVIGGTQKGVVIGGATTTGTIVQGNYIGLNSAGNAAIPNTVGVDLLDFTTGNTIGGSNPGEGNVLSGNISWGMRFSRSDSNTLAGNIIGLGADGNTIIGNGAYGVFLEGVAADIPENNMIGGPTAAARNIISGNGLDGINVGTNVGSNTIRNNAIGTNSSGTLARPNGRHGINMVNGATGVQVLDNLIRGNGGSGVLIAGDTAGGNVVRANAIYDNALIGIDLGGQAGTSTGDGVTFNHQGLIAGPNSYQNYPVISLASTNGTQLRVAGTLVAQGGQGFDIDVYASQTCDPSFFGEGQIYLGSFFVGTDEAGQGSFDQTLVTSTPEPYGITMVATGPDGSSEFSYCRPVTTNNLTWLDAQELSLEPLSAGSVGSDARQYILDYYQEKWFKFPVNPGDTVHMTLSGQPGSGITLHRDPTSFYNGLENPPSAAVLSAAAADTAFLPSQSLPSQSLPSQSLPSQSLPADSLLIGYLPSQSLPSQSLPSQSLPSQSLPSQSLPSQSLPTGTLPSQSLPSQSLPSQSLPSQSLPSQSLPEAYSGAARRSLMAAALDPYATTQTIERTVYDLQEDLYVRVIGPYDPANPFTLEVAVDLGVCGSLQQVPDALPVIAGDPASGSFQTFILTDRGRLSGSAGEVATALSKLNTLAARADVQGVVIDLGHTLTTGGPRFPRVEWANAQADRLPVCPSAKNTVAREIKAVIDAYQAVNGAGGAAPLKYLVLAGGADVIPFFQVADLSGLASEKEYVPPVRPETPSEAGLRVGLVKGQDFYGSTVDLTLGDRVLAMPDLAVGRLVETAADISAIVDNYIRTGGVMTPSSALVTGYDFVGDAAEVIQGELALGTTPPNETPAIDTLIQPVGEAPSGPNAWTADDLRAKLYAGTFDIAVLSGHFSAGNLLAADYRTTLSAAEVAVAPADLSDRLILALGCHGGFSIPSSDLLASGSPDPDWAKAFLRKGVAGYIAATGYAYGDTELTEYGERLFVGLTQELRTGSGPVALGQALVAAKQRYLAETAQLSGIDEKTIVEMTLYGLPMMQIDMPGERIDPDVEASIVSTTTAVSEGPGAQIGLRVGLPSNGAVVLNTTPQRVALPNLEHGGTVTTTYLAGDDGVVANPFEPILPKDLFNVGVNGLVLRGIGFRGGSYADLDNIVPLTTAPAIETSRPSQSFETDTFYPGQVLLSNFYDALGGGPERMIAVPAQFKSRAPGAIDGTLRSYSSIDLALYYLPEGWQGQETARAAVVAQAPTILAASGKADNGVVTFNVNALGDGVAGVQAVWVVYTSSNAGDPLYGQWQPLDLAPSTTLPIDESLWQGQLTLPIGVNPEQVQFMVQAVNGAGLTSLATNLGAYYPVKLEGQPEPTPAPTSISLTLAPSTGTYLRDSSFQVRLTSDGQPLAGLPMLLSLGGLGAQAVTDGSGLASFTLRPILAPGDYTLQATFRGSDSYESSVASTAFSIGRESTSIALNPASATVVPGAGTPFIATLTDGAGRFLPNKSIVFVVGGNGQRLVRAVNSDLQGQAALGRLDLPEGSYSVSAYFSGSIPLGDGQSLELSNDYYTGASSPQRSLTIGAVVDTTPPALNPTVSPNPVYLNGTATASAGATDDLSGVATQSCGPVDTSSVGTQTVTCTATDNAGNSASATATYQVIFPFSGFFQPIDNPPTHNQAGAGQSIPIKFSLSGNYGLNIFASDYPASGSIPCDSTAPVSEVEGVASPGASGLTYDTSTGQYSYTWKTSRAWKGSCRQLVIRFVDGQEFRANFRFK